MKFTQYYLECLSQASYLIGDETTGRAVVVDPRRDIDQYLDDANAAGLTIELVIETHFHADFLSGHLELAAATGAEIGYSSVANTEFESRALRDGEQISLGEVTLEIRHTPGHTPESLSIVVTERPGEAPYGVLTGDTLFIGDVGRPDLLASTGVTAEALASQLHHSLHTQLLTLPDPTRVYPAHGAGSSCGRQLSTETVSTIGEQRRTNQALQAPDEATFIALVTEGLPTAPDYFGYDAALNGMNRGLLDESQPPRALGLDDLDDALAAGAILIDARSPEEFALGHLAGSINVGLGGRFAEFTGSVVPHHADIVLLVDEGSEVEAKNRLGRIGFDRVIGHLEHPLDVMTRHPDRVERGSRLTVREFASRRSELDGVQLLDVRNPGEIAEGSIEGAIPAPLRQLGDHLDPLDQRDQLDPAAPTVVFCAGGYRSSIAASLLRRAGFVDVSDILGGHGAWAILDTEQPEASL